MNLSFKNILRYAVPVAVIVGLIGCIQIKVIVNSPKPQVSAEGKPKEPPPPPIIGGPPTTVFGSINVPITSLQTGNNGQTCFPNPPWDKYYIVVTNFPGPNTTPDASSFANTENSSLVTVKTCNPANGSTLETGIVIYEQFHPSTDKQCVTNSPACADSANLTINQRSIVSGKKYRAVVHYKSATLGALTSVEVDYSYP